MRELTRVIDEADAGRQLKYLVRGGMGLSYHQFSALKASGGMWINGVPARANAILKLGDVVTLRLEDAPRSPVPFEMAPVNVVYEDEDLLIIDKPAPLPCQCSPKQTAMTLENRLAWRYRDVPGYVFRPVNRLDKGTSGLMAAAMNAHAAQLLQKQLHTDQFIREYLAVVEGEMTGEGVIDAPIAKEAAATVRRVVDFVRGVEAVTHYRAEGNFGPYTLVRLRLQTGRTHQIRVHLSHLGHPIVGDFLYGTEDPRLPGRFALHSTYIHLLHPISGQIVEAASPLPGTLAALISE